MLARSLMGPDGFPIVQSHYEFNRSALLHFTSKRRPFPFGGIRLRPRAARWPCFADNVHRNSMRHVNWLTGGAGDPN